METKNLPVGIEDFKKLRQRNYYYVDKTDFIAETFKDEVALYTRPRRFGKTLTMSMLKYFYSVKEKPEKEEDDIFKDLYISRNEEAKRHRNRYPVICLSFKDLERDNFSSFLYGLSEKMRELYYSFPELKNSDKLNDLEKEKYSLYTSGTVNPDQLLDSLRILSKCLSSHYGENAIILIDEYDVPLERSFKYGFYEEMTRFMRLFLSSALKTNDYLEKAILTGCLRISQESIFTGLNNFSVFSVMEKKAASSFGFTQEEVNRMYSEYGFSDKLPKVRKWYDGYLFGGIEIYNPWSALQFLQALNQDSNEDPVSYWANTSSNTLVTRYIENADRQMMEEFQNLADGKTIEKEIFPNLTYREMENPDNIYSFLLLTGYLKAVKKGRGKNTWKLKIPNLEVKEIYEQHFNKIFTKTKKILVPELLIALKNNDNQKIQKLVTELLDRYISFFDNHEDYYHGFMTGLFSNRYGWDVQSNLESGDGRFDIRLISDDNQNLIILECKKSDTPDDLEKDAAEGLEQIHKKRYLNNARTEHYPNRLGYGISFHKKNCCVKNNEILKG